MLPAPGTPERARALAAARRQIAVGVLVALVVIVGGGGYTGLVPISATQVADAAGVLLLVVIVGFFGWMYSSSEWTPDERKRLYVIGVLFLAASLFWSVFEQAGSTLNLFADRNTYNNFFGFAFPEQLVPVDELVLPDHLRADHGVGVGQDGGRRARSRRRRPSSAWGLVFVGLGFAILILPAQQSGSSPARCG